MKTKELKHLLHLRSCGALVALRDNEPLESRSLKPLTPWRRISRANVSLADLFNTTREFRRAVTKWKYEPYAELGQIPVGKSVRYYRKTDTRLTQPFILLGVKVGYGAVDGALCHFSVAMHRCGETLIGVDAKTLFRKFVFDHSEWRSTEEPAPKHVSECRVCGNKVLGGAQ